MSLPHVSSEGGPIILGDFETLRAWRGVSDPSGHYDTACELVERTNPSPIKVGSGNSLVWDFGGPGTGDIIVVNNKHISIVRIWPDASWTESETEAVIVASATARFGSELAAYLTIHSGYLLALWATEDASGFLLPRGESGIPEPGLSIGDGGAYVRVPCGRYEVSACEWQAERFDIAKLDLRRTETNGFVH